MADQCSATTEAGHRCRQRSTVNDTGLCLLHDPKRRALAQAARRKGARASAKAKVAGRIKTVSPEEAPANPTTIAEVAGYASWALGALTTGAIDARTAREITGLLGRVQNALKDSKVVDEIAELRERMDEIQRKRVGVVR